MAIKNESKTSFVLRLFGLTGAVVAVAGGVLWLAFGGAGIGRPAAIVAGLGLGVFVLALLIEMRGAAHAVSSHRGALGLSVFSQVALATVLLAGVNAFSFLHYTRFDWTWDRAFTLPSDLRAQLSKLRDDTDIVVLQQYISFAQRGEGKQDRYDLAAQKKIIEKVKDLAEQFQDLGPRFRVQVLDIQDEDFDKRVTQIREQEEAASKARGEPASSPLADAIKKAPENSIFFHAKGRVQRLGFHDIYQIDKEASASANGGAGNLVLNFQGVEPFARAILNIEARQPRVAVAVVHPALSMASRESPILTMNGAKNFLDSQGFVTKDILLRKIDPDGDLSEEAAAQSFDENRYEQIVEELSILDSALTHNEKAIASFRKELDTWKNQPLAELQKSWVYVAIPGRQFVAPKEILTQLEQQKVPHKAIPVDEEDRKNMIARYTAEIEVGDRAVAEARKERDSLFQEKSKLNVDDLAEKRRITDVEAKMKRMLADTDLLIIPRFTIYKLASEQILRNRLHKIDATQLAAIKAFLKEGKPVMFLLGPTNEKREMPFDPQGGGADGVEAMLAELGVRLPKQTIIFSAEAKEFNERKLNIGFSSRETEVPAVLFDWKSGAGQVGKGEGDKKKNPIRLSLWLTSQAVGSKQAKDLQIRHPRPVYAVGGNGAFDEEAVFLMAGPESWNEDFPFLNDKREPPQYQPTDPKDAKKGTIEEERRGPFPIAVAVERTLPADWFTGGAKPTKARLAVIGNGAVFVGTSLNPMREKLLLDVSNWLLGRDDLLARQQETWSFPRVALSETQSKLWHWGMFIGLPLVFVYLGILMLFVRRLR